MKRRYRMIAVVFLLTGSLWACGVPLEDRAFPLSVAVDYTEGKYEVYYGMPDLSAETGQDKEGENSGQKETVVCYRGRSMEETEELFLRSQEDYLDLGHVKAFLLGENLLKNKNAYEALLAYLEEKPSVAGNIYVFSCRSPREIMELEGTELDSLGTFLVRIVESRPYSRQEEQTDLQSLYNAWHNQENRPSMLQVEAEGQTLLVKGNLYERE
ncbi:MAG: hypothetical protein ACI4E0_09875 [Blautia sp.]|nr:hypothetical protein [Blautia sp.]MDD7370362.1 hypothetical protein [Bacillota bacterium]MDY3715029.1 hypothetical protein [Blautia sp.]